MLKNMPIPTATHLETLSECLEATYEKIRLSEKDAAARKEVIAMVEAILDRSSILQGEHSGLVRDVYK